MHIDEQVLDAFWDLFRGRNDVWGSVEGRANKEQVAIGHYAEHLTGKESLGIYPLLNDGTCHFAAVDVDEKDFNKALTIRKKLLNLGVNSYIAASKSKGFHVYIFAEEKFVARDIRRLLQHALGKLKIKAEIFPKQDEVTEQTPYGNYINLPCFGHTRPFLSGEMKEVPIDIALQRIKPVSSQELKKLVEKLPGEEPPRTHKEGTTRAGKLPCFSKMMTGVPEGCRDEVGFRLAVHLYRQGMPQQLSESTLLQWDMSYNKPPIGSTTILQKVKQAYSGRYGLGCLNPLITEFCDSSCPIFRKRHTEIDFYRKGEEGKEAEVLGLRRLKSHPPSFALIIDGNEIELTAADLLSLRKVKTKAIEELSYVPFSGVKATDWETLVNSLLKDIVDEKAPPDASVDARYIESLYEWLESSPEAESQEDVLAGKPIKRKDGYYFRMKDAINYLTKQQRLTIDPSQLYRIVKKVGGDARSIRIGKVFKLWYLPNKEEEAESE